MRDFRNVYIFCQSNISARYLWNGKKWICPSPLPCFEQKLFEVTQWSVFDESIAHEHPSFEASHRVAGTAMESRSKKKFVWIKPFLLSKAWNLETRWLPCTSEGLSIHFSPAWYEDRFHFDLFRSSLHICGKISFLSAFLSGYIYFRLWSVEHWFAEVAFFSVFVAVSAEEEIRWHSTALLRSSLYEEEHSHGMTIGTGLLHFIVTGINHNIWSFMIISYFYEPFI